ncbi:MAG: A/G-specific adenine glycosylase [Candidatus Omnitrophota bacterium]
MTVRQFRTIIYAYYARHKRQMPWRDTRNSYHILVSEVMLQQTQVTRVLDKYAGFTRVFPDIRTLARASLADILSEWQGLGYNRRALLLKRLAERVVTDYGGRIPCEREILKTLPGIGEATSGAVCAFAFDQPVVFIETNIRSVFIHHFFRDKKEVSDTRLLPWIEKTLDRKKPREWYYALMDYGVYLKSEFPNPSRKSSHYAKQGKFEGSVRQIRGKILKILLSRRRLPVCELYELVCPDKKRCDTIADALCEEGLLKKRGGFLSLP